ncbi:charged multivesicular body protein 7-like [Babylonia areolata]|uniref:charged multivesicular body protein 7-like n=1 Tax=Babylonia areolata TaxID=304850 RepID=UPI003FCF5688
MSSKYLSSPEWTDDQKAAVLFAPFREKSLNPHSWERKMKFWTDALVECAEEQNDIVMDLKTFTNRFERQGKYPKCLDAVAIEMVRVGKLQKLSDFQRRSNSWTVWGFDTFVRRPLTWGLTKLTSSPSSAENMFIIPEQVKKKSKEVLDCHYSQVEHETTDNMMELSAFRTRCGQVLKSDAECDIVLKQLELDGKVLTTRDKEGNMIVKVCGQCEDKVQPVQEIELNIMRIQRVMKGLEKQMEALSGQVDVHTAQARALVKEGKKTLALHQLRKRRTLQRQIDRKSSCFDTLHDIIHRIEDSSSNDMVVKAYESGLSAIKQLTGDMTMNKVDKVLDDLQEVFEEQEEINQSIAGVSLPGSEVSADDLEQELDNLLAGKDERSHEDLAAAQSNTNVEDLVTRLATHTLDDLPDVPTSSPGSRSPAISPKKNPSYAS